MREEFNTNTNVTEGTLYKVTVKKPVTGYEHGATLLEMHSSLAEGMKMANEIIAKYDQDSKKVICYDTEAKAEKAIGFVAKISDENGNSLKRDEFADLISGGNCTGVIKGADPGTGTFDVDLYLTEKEIISGGVVVSTDAFEEEIKRIVDEGISTREVLEKNIQVMRENRIGEGRILTVLKRYKKYDKPAWIPDAYYVDVNPEMPKSILNRALKASLITGHALVFEGDKSVGKNVCGETIAAVRGMPYFFMGFDAYMTTDTVYGESKTDNSAGAQLELRQAMSYIKAQTMPQEATKEELEEAATFDFLKAKAATVQIIREYSELVKWAQCGGVMMFNEYNMGDANLKQQFMNPMLDSTRALDVPGLGMLRLNPDCVLICSANPGFVGEMAENAATRSRLGTIKFPNASEIIKQLKSSLGENFLPERYFVTCNEFYKAIKAMVGTISDQCLNIRGFKRALEDVKQDILDGEEPSLADDIITEVIDSCPEEDISHLEMQLREIVNI